MSEKNNINREEEVGEYKVPEFYVAKWQDDIPEEAEDEEKMLNFEFMKGEKEYISPKKISPEAAEKLLLRAKRMKLIGRKIMNLQ